MDLITSNEMHLMLVWSRGARRVRRGNKGRDVLLFETRTRSRQLLFAAFV